jgi:hypothetical protein
MHLCVSEAWWILTICDVRVGKALGFLSALSWVHELSLGLVDFELIEYSKLVIDGFHSNNHDVTEFGEIILHCRRLISMLTIVLNLLGGKK